VTGSFEQLRLGERGTHGESLWIEPGSCHKLTAAYVSESYVAADFSPVEGMLPVDLAVMTDCRRWKLSPQILQESRISVRTGNKVEIFIGLV
jgi:hypothetical protein